MMKFLNTKKGVTALEGIIALGLLAVVMAGAFGVLLSASRKSSQPDMREEMVMAVEKAKDMLQMYVNPAGYSTSPDSTVSYPTGLCPDENGNTTPLKGGETHYIKCMLPPICDKTSNQSDFYYQVEDASSPSFRLVGADIEGGIDSSLKTITFTIKCNGYEL